MAATIHRAGTSPSKTDGRVEQQTRLHKRGNVYYFRARISQSIQHLYAPQTEIKFSLRTASLKKAKALVNLFSVKYDAAAKTTTFTIASQGSGVVEGGDFMKGTWSIWFGNIDQPKLGAELISRL